jgi:outer membrane immunogenic protein
VFGGATRVNHDAGLSVLGFSDVLALDSFDNDVQLGLGAGCDLQVMPQFLVGVFADWASQESKATFDLDFAVSATLPMGDQWSVGGRAGFLSSPQTLIYLLVAYTQAEGEPFALTICGCSVASFAVSDWTGWSLGGGIETMITDNLTARVEYRYTEFDRQSVLIDPLVFNFDSDQHVVRIGVGYRIP